MKSLSHCKYETYYHLVLTSKYRRKVIVGEFREFLYKVIKEISSNVGVELINMNGSSDHLHLLISFSPTLSISEVVRTIKSVSSKVSFSAFNSYLRKYFWYKNTLWSRSYYVATHGNVTKETVRSYIDNQ